MLFKKIQNNKGIFVIITKNRLLDIVRFKDQDVFVMYNNRDSTFLPDKPVLTNFYYDNGWCVPESECKCYFALYATMPGHGMIATQMAT